MKETEGKFRGDLGKATGDTSEHVKGRAEEANPYLAALKKKKMEDSPDTGDRARLLSEIS